MSPCGGYMAACLHGLLEPSGEPVNPSVGCCTRRAATSLGNPTPASVVAGRLVGPILVDAVGPCLSLHRLSMKLPGNSRAGGQGCEPFPVSAARGEAPSTIGRSELLPGHPDRKSTRLNSSH